MTIIICVCVCVCVFVYMCVYVCVYLCVYICVYVCSTHTALRTPHVECMQACRDHPQCSV